MTSLLSYGGRGAEEDTTRKCTYEKSGKMNGIRRGDGVGRRAVKFLK